MPSNDKTTKKLRYNEKLPTLYIDGIVLNHREDSMNLIHLVVDLPDAIQEQARIMASDESLKGIVNALCRNIKYYPEPPIDTAKEK